MSQYFTTYFTSKHTWKSCDVIEVGIYRTELAAMQAGQQSALTHPEWNAHAARSLTWRRVPGGLVAKTLFGRYDIRPAAAESSPVSPRSSAD